MFTKILLPDTVRAIKLISNLSAIKQAYLAGGTALALQLGHRISADLDFFTNNDFKEEVVALELSSIPQFIEEGKSWKTLWGKVSETKFSYFFYKYPLLEKTVFFEGIELAGIRDIAAMKIHAIEDRGTKRDFIDLFFLTKKFTLDDMLTFYQQKYACLNDHLYSIIRSLHYFIDADSDIIPKMLTNIVWEEVKKYFKQEATRLAKEKLLSKQ